ncbi:MAG: ABC transporter substrate-binding protein [Alphaproteobacteria bacterium]|nr:ABC transporter substrate-binding protein [Alphaproteobacteria bacterium]
MHDFIQKKILSLAKMATITIAMSAIIISFILYQTHSSPSTRIIAISQFAAHPSLDRIRLGILEELNKNDYLHKNKIQIVYENANGSLSSAHQIAQKLMHIEPTVVVGIATPSAQSLNAANKTKSIPLVFSGVTDPISANLVKDLDITAENVTGTLDLPPMKNQITLLQKIVPDLKRLGILYNPKEINSIKQIEKLTPFAQIEGIEIIKSPAHKSGDVFTAATKLVGQVDAIYIPNDNTIASAIKSVVRVANENKIPTMASDDQSTKEGILVSLANDSFLIGQETGKIIIRILNGEPIREIDVCIPSQLNFTINEQTAKLLSIPLDRINLD